MTRLNKNHIFSNCCTYQGIKPKTPPPVKTPLPQIAPQAKNFKTPRPTFENFKLKTLKPRREIWKILKNLKTPRGARNFFELFWVKLVNFASFLRRRRKFWGKIGEIHGFSSKITSNRAPQARKILSTFGNSEKSQNPVSTFWKFWKSQNPPPCFGFSFFKISNPPPSGQN